MTRIARSVALAAFGCALVCRDPLFAAQPVHIAVDFLADGRCAVSEQGERFHASLSYVAPAGVSPDVELRCTIPAPPKGFPVELVVSLPPGFPLPGGEFPRMQWKDEGGRWQGTAALPSAPAFVRVLQAGASTVYRSSRSTADDTIRFGWNFYGWFVFAGLFIGSYFLGVRLSRARA